MQAIGMDHLHVMRSEHQLHHESKVALAVSLVALQQNCPVDLLSGMLNLECQVVE